MKVLFSKPLYLKLLKIKPLHIGLALFLAILSLSSRADAITAEFQGFVLKVDWGAPPSPNGHWRISIYHTHGLGTDVLASCGPGVAGWGICGGDIDASGHFERDFTAQMLEGGYVADYQITVNIEAMDQNGSPTGFTDSYSGYLVTPPVSMALVGDTDNQKGRALNLLRKPLAVGLKRNGQPMTAGAIYLVTSSMLTAPSGATGHSFGEKYWQDGSVRIPFKLGNKQGGYYVNVSCPSCNHSQGEMIHIKARTAPVTLKVKVDPATVWPNKTSGNPKMS